MFQLRVCQSGRTLGLLSVLGRGRPWTRERNIDGVLAYDSAMLTLHYMIFLLSNLKNGVPWPVAKIYTDPPEIITSIFSLLMEVIAN
jgi:hypothetical protein